MWSAMPLLETEPVIIDSEGVVKADDPEKGLRILARIIARLVLQAQDQERPSQHEREDQGEADA